jgi:hypothetical protein
MVVDYTMYIPGIFHVYTVRVVIYHVYFMNIDSTYQVYTICIHGIYHEYTIYMHGIFAVYTCDIQNIYLEYTLYNSGGIYHVKWHVYTKYVPSTSNQKHEGAERPHALISDHCGSWSVLS